LSFQQQNAARFMWIGRHFYVVVTETAAICAYLAKQFPQQRLAPPADSLERGTYYRWLFFVAGPVEAAVTAKALGLLAPRGQARHRRLWHL
jgi:glutathione S-transferase